MAQRPYLLPTTLTIDAGAGDPDSLRWLVIVTVVAVLLVGPALALLYRLDLTDRLRADHDADLGEDLIRPPLIGSEAARRWGGRARAAPAGMGRAVSCRPRPSQDALDVPGGEELEGRQGSGGDADEGVHGLLVAVRRGRGVVASPGGGVSRVAIWVVNS